MGSKSDYLENKFIDWYYRGQAFTPPATHHFALLTCTKGQRANSTAYALNDTVALIANDTKVHLYKCTTAGTSAAAQATLFPGVANEVITDGTAVFTEQTSALESGVACVEPNWPGYERSSVTSSLANFAGTQGSGTTTVSSGTSGQTSNNNAIPFTVPSSGTGPWYVWGMATYDAATSGNLQYWSENTSIKIINFGIDALSFPVGSMSITEG